MNQITIILAFLMTIGSQAMAINGQMDCKVKTNRITTISEGIGTEYTGYQDDFVVGDTLNLFYEFVNDELTVKIRDSKRRSNLWNNTVTYIAGSDSKFHSQEDGSAAGLSRANNSNSLGQDTIRSRGLHFIMTDGDMKAADGQVNLNRYYKNDWDGIIYYSGRLRAVHVVTIDCRHIRDQLDNIISALIEAEDKLQSKE